MSVKDRTYILVTLVFLLVSSYFAVSNIMTRYTYYKQNLRQDRYFIENYHSQLTSRINKTLKSGLTRLASDDTVINSVNTGDSKTLAVQVEKHLSTLGYEYPSDIFIVNVLDRNGSLLYSSDKSEGNCTAPTKASFGSLASRSGQSAFVVCSDKVMQFSSVPLFVKGEVTGAVETGISLDFYSNNMEQAIGYSMALLVRKNQLKSGHNPLLACGDYVMMHNNNLSMFRRIFTQNINFDSIGDRVDVKNLSFRIIDTISFYDSAGKDAGRFVYAKDITEEVSWLRTYIYKTVFITVLFCLVSLYVIRSGFTKYIGQLEQKYEKSTRELELSEAKYKSYVDNSPIAIFTLNQSKKISSANIQACDIFETPYSEIIGSEVHSLFESVPVPVIDNFLKRVTFSKTAETTLALTDKSGFSVHLFVKAVKLTDSSVLFNCIDISPVIKAEQKLQELNKELEQMNRTLEVRIADEVEKNRRQTHLMAEQKKLADMGLMVSAIAHQWRQPLNALGMLVQTLPEQLEISHDSKHLKNLEDTAMGLIGSMSATLDNFRVFFESGKDKTLFNIPEEMKASFDLLSANIRASGCETEFCCRREEEDKFSHQNNCGRCKEINVFGLQGDFRLIMVNLVQNCLEAISQSRKKTQGRITVITVCGAEKVCITIEDNGTGVSEEDLPRIFEPYFTKKNDAQSAGIGLYMVKVMTERNFGGKVFAFNNHKGGLSVAIELPVRRSISPER